MIAFNRGDIMSELDAIIGLYMDDHIIDLFQGEPGSVIFLDAFKFSESYYRYLKKSMDSLEFENSSLQDFSAIWKDYRDSLQKFFCSKDVVETIKLKRHIERVSLDLKFYEDQVKVKFTQDWNLHLTKLQEGEFKEFAVIVQVLSNEDFRNPGRGKVIASSLFTEHLQVLYQHRCLGFVYDLVDKDILLASTSDANSSFSELEEFDPRLSYHSNVIGSILGRAFLREEAFFSFKEFKDKCSSDHLNEILFNRTSWRNQLPSGVFIREGISEENRELALMTAKLRKIPICEYIGGVLKIYSVH